MIKFLSCIFLVIVCSIFSSGIAFAQSDKPQPTQVLIGTYVQNIVDLNLRTNNVTVDFYMWFRWKGDKVKPYETFEIANGKINSKNVVL